MPEVHTNTITTMPDKSVSISVVLPNYNGRHLLEENLPSLIEAISDFEYEIIVVDDCSSDDSAHFLKTTYPAIRVLVNEVNAGFSYTCNRGIFAASKQLLCVVNTDVTFTFDYFHKSINEFDDPLLFAIKGDIINYRDTTDDIINTDRTTLLYYKHGFLRFDTHKPLSCRHSISGNDSQFVCLGCCFICNRRMMLQLRGFDEIYSPFYWEDCDLGRRAMEKGFRLLYLPKARVYHKSSSTLSRYRSDTRRRLVSNRNKFLFTWRHLDTGEILLSHLPVTLLNILTRWLALDWKYYVALMWALLRKLTYRQKIS